LVRLASRRDRSRSAGSATRVRVEAGDRPPTIGTSARKEVERRSIKEFQTFAALKKTNCNRRMAAGPTVMAVHHPCGLDFPVYGFDSNPVSGGECMPQARNNLISRNHECHVAPASKSSNKNGVQRSVLRGCDAGRSIDFHLTCGRPGEALHHGVMSRHRRFRLRQ